MQDFIKYIGLRIVLLISIVLISNKIYEVTFWKSDISKHGDILENLWQVNEDADVIYFGESSNFHGTLMDSNQFAISTVLDKQLPDLKVDVIHNSGIHAGTYYAVIQNIPESHKVKYLVITMNFRSFTSNWRYSQSENYLAKTERMLEPGLPVFNRFMVSLKAYDYKTNKERSEQVNKDWRKPLGLPDFRYDNVISWDSAMAWQTWINDNEDLNIDNIPLACHYIKNFAFNIDTLTNERIMDFDNIMNLAHQKGYTIVFNLLGENIEEGEKLVGSHLTSLIETNRQLLVKRYTKKGAVVVDNLYNVPDSCFIDRGWPTEHYNQTGKNLIANSLAKKIQEIRRDELQK